jgi:lipoprotein NlpD
LLISLSKAHIRYFLFGIQGMSRVQKKGFQWRCLLWASFAGAVLLAGCSAPEHRPPAPITDGGTTTVYTVQRGDTLYSIARRFGVDPVLVARQNNLINPSQLAVGQRLRIGIDRRPAPPKPHWNGAVAQPVPVTGPSAGQYPAAKPQQAAPQPAPDYSLKPAEPKPAAAAGRFQWPAAGSVIKGYGDSNKGLDIAVKEGSPVKAAADGQVLFVGQVRGYGNLVIVKHDATYVTAYGNNKSIDVKQGASVKQGQRIATAGKTDDEPVRVHFEIRQGGKAINPTGLLPAR